MTCEHVQLPGGGAAIVCSSHRAQRCACGRRARLLCDWKVPSRRSGTCDAPICATCTTSPAADKDLCPEHALAWAAWKTRRTDAPSSGRAPECAPLTDLDAPAAPDAGVSAPQGRSSNPALAAAEPEHCLS